MSTTSDEPSAAASPTNDAAAASPATPGSSWYQYWAALVALVLVSVGFGAIAPSLANILVELSVTASVGSLLVSALGIGR